MSATERITPIVKKPLTPQPPPRIEETSPWDGVIFPGNLRNQFREQFGARLSQHMPRVNDSFREITMHEVLNTFDLADRHIGRHWPFLATSLWQYGTHVLISAYFETSGTVADAMQGLLSTSTASYPVFTATSELTAEGLVVRTRPTYELGQRHWNIFQILGVLSQTALFKRFAPEETKHIEYNITTPADEFSNMLTSITTSKIKFDIPLDEASTLYPMALLRRKISHKHHELNKVLFAEIQRQTQLPSYEDNILNDLRRHIYSRFPKTLQTHEAAELLNMSRSTFQRMLKRRDMKFSAIVHELKKEYVLIYLSRAGPYDAHHTALGFPSRRALSAFCTAAFGVPVQKLLNQEP